MTTRTLKGRSLADGFDLQAFVTHSPLNFLEIGCFDGHNLGKFAEMFPDRVFYGIDPFVSDGHVGPEGRELTEQRENLKHNIEGLANVKFFEMTSKRFAEESGDHSSKNIGAVFIDGAHILEHIKVDVDLSLSLFSQNENKSGVVGFHDLRLQDVQEGIEYLREQAKAKNLACVPWSYAGGIEQYHGHAATNGCFMVRPKTEQELAETQ